MERICFKSSYVLDEGQALPALFLIVADRDVDLNGRDLGLVDQILVVQQREDDARRGRFGFQEAHVVDALDVLHYLLEAELGQDGVPHLGQDGKL